MREIDDFTSAVTGLAASQRASAKHGGGRGAGTASTSAAVKLSAAEAFAAELTQWRGAGGVQVTDLDGALSTLRACSAQEFRVHARPDRAEASHAAQPTVVAEEAPDDVLRAGRTAGSAEIFAAKRAAVDGQPSMAAAESPRAAAVGGQASDERDGAIYAELKQVREMVAALAAKAESTEGTAHEAAEREGPAADGPAAAAAEAAAAEAAEAAAEAAAAAAEAAEAAAVDLSASARALEAEVAQREIAEMAEMA